MISCIARAMNASSIVDFADLNSSFANSEKDYLGNIMNYFLQGLDCTSLCFSDAELSIREAQIIALAAQHSNVTTMKLMRLNMTASSLRSIVELLLTMKLS